MTTRSTTEWMNNYTEECYDAGELTEMDRQELKMLLANKTVKRCFGLLIQEINGKLNTIATTPLVSDDLIKMMIMEQGQIAGMRRCIELFLDETINPNDEETTNE